MRTKPKPLATFPLTTHGFAIAGFPSIHLLEVVPRFANGNLKLQVILWCFYTPEKNGWKLTFFLSTWKIKLHLQKHPSLFAPSIYFHFLVLLKKSKRKKSLFKGLYLLHPVTWESRWAEEFTPFTGKGNGMMKVVTNAWDFSSICGAQNRFHGKHRL